ncbi:MAG TPA: hypothetical protein VIX73_38870 [Kofleriaceae bacterium]
MSPVLDLRIAIDRIHVCCGALAVRPAPPPLVTGRLGGGAGARPGDHRIVIRELRIDVEAELDATAARRLGNDVARELAARLAALQDRRQPGRSHARAAGPIQVETLRVHLWGEAARHPPSPQIAEALMTALEERVGDAS